MARPLNPHVKLMTHKEMVKVFIDKGISVDEILTKNSLDSLDGFRYNTLTGIIMTKEGRFPKGLTQQKNSALTFDEATGQCEDTPFMGEWKKWSVEDRENIPKTGLFRIAMAQNEEQLDKAMQIYANYLTAKKKNTEITQEPVEVIIGDAELLQTLLDTMKRI